MLFKATDFVRIENQQTAPQFQPSTWLINMHVCENTNMEALLEADITTDCTSGNLQGSKAKCECQKLQFLQWQLEACSKTGLIPTDSHVNISNFSNEFLIFGALQRFGLCSSVQPSKQIQGLIIYLFFLVFITYPFEFQTKSIGCG